MQGTIGSFFQNSGEDSVICAECLFTGFLVEHNLLCEVLIAGFLYIVDFEHMVQVRRNDISRRRRVKRDLASVPKKGIAGIRLEEPARGGTASGVPVCTTVQQCSASEEMHGRTLRDDSASVDEGTGGRNTVQHDGIYSESNAELPDPSGGDHRSLLSEEDAEELSITISIDALHLDSTEMGSGDTLLEPPYRMSLVGRRMYYEDNL